jgi:hypothetical protein
VTGLLLSPYRREHDYLLRDACLLSGAVELVIFAPSAATTPGQATDRPGMVAPRRRAAPDACGTKPTAAPAIRPAAR